MHCAALELLLGVIQLWSLDICHAMVCEKTGPCSCKSDKGIIDLSPLTGNPRFKDRPSPKRINVYSYNPCTPFSEGKYCKNVAACQLNTQLQLTIPTGTQDTATFSIDSSNNPTIKYTALGQDNVYRTTVVTLVCIKDGGPDTLDFVGEHPQTVYSMTLMSSHCCPKIVPSESGILSVGSILLIVVIAIALVYIVVGIVIQVKVRKASGKERFPNYTFWSLLPGHIKDGFIFSFSKCTRRSTYQQI